MNASQLEEGEFHYHDGWTFKRMDDGQVRIRNLILGTIVKIPDSVWDSIVDHCKKPAA